MLVQFPRWFMTDPCNVFRLAVLSSREWSWALHADFAPSKNATELQETR